MTGPVNPVEFLSEIEQLATGEKVRYYRGYLPTGANKMVRKLADAAAIMETYSIVHLVQKRLGFQLYEYFAVRSVERKIPPRLRYEIGKLG